MQHDTADRFRSRAWGATLLALATLASPVFADDALDASADDFASSADAEPVAAEAPAATGGAAKPEADPAKLPDFDAISKGMTEVEPIDDEGLFRLYRYDESDRKNVPTRLLARIPASLLGQDVLFATSMSAGQLAGFMWGDEHVRFVLRGPNLVLESPNSRYVTEGDSPVYESIRRTYRPRILAALPVLTMVGGDPVVDFGELFTSEVARLPGTARPDKKLSQYRSIKIFPDNVLVDVDLAFKGRRDSFDTLGITYAFRRLPGDNGYQPRVADERVGFFITARQDWAADRTEPETVRRYVNRWHLDKLDPSLELSPPKRPIVFILEQTIPVQWRRYVKEGVLEWNKAFEKLGYTDAVVVQQQTATNEYADYDPEDARHNFIRWITIGRSFALGPSRVDPRTGQILDADIVIDDSFLRAFEYRADVMSPLQLRAMYGTGLDELAERYPAFAERLPFHAELAREHGPWLRDDHDHDHHDADGHAVDPLAIVGDAPDAWHGGHACQLSAGLHHEVSMLAAAFQQGPGQVLPERLLGEMIKKVVTHEVGHTLGLRHNFHGSAWLELDEVKRRRDHTDEPTSASIMDYAPVLFFPGDDLETVRHLVEPGIGPYDYWAIEYGYASPAAGQSEAEMLREIAARNTEPALAYLPDEDSSWIGSPDPFGNRWDMSSEPLAWAEMRTQHTDRLIENLESWAVQPGDPGYYLRSIFNTILNERLRNAGFVGRLVSGQSFHRNRRDDPGAVPAFVPVPGETQRRAIGFIADTAFSAETFGFDAELLNDLAPIRWKDWATPQRSRLDYPIHEMAASLQVKAMLPLISPDALQRVYDAELKAVEDDPLTVAELVTSVRDEVWSELGGLGDRGYTHADPAIPSIRRNLQSLHLALLLAYAEPGRRLFASPDVHHLARFAARELGDQIEAALDAHGESLDFATRAHLVENLSLIRRNLEAQFEAR